LAGDGIELLGDEPCPVIHPGNGTHIVYLTFEARRAGGMVRDIAAGTDTTPIRGVEFVKRCDLAVLLLQ
jgi:hypothetical protein